MQGVSQLGANVTTFTEEMTDALEYVRTADVIISGIGKPHFIEITDEGRVITDRFLPGIRKLEQAILGELSRTEQATLLKLLGKVLDAAARVAVAEPIVLEGRRNRPATR